jgi:hypothetical protein
MNPETGFLRILMLSNDKFRKKPGFSSLGEESRNRVSTNFDVE